MDFNVIDIFEENKLVKICAPMVRYSKLPFRSLVRKYDCDLCFTPMIMADSFIRSEKARNNEFTTNKLDKPLIVQFAAMTPEEFSSATELVAPYCNGVDLNCGCPQRWAMKLGIGAQLLSSPETVKEIVRTVKSRVSNNFSVSVKMRLLSDLKQTVELCRQLESAGVNFLTVHARTKEQKAEPVNVGILKEISSSINIPLVANGDVRNMEDAMKMQKLTNCQGVMSARGLLQNPAMFSGYTTTPVDCIKEWIEISLATNLHFITFHHHLVFMLEKIIKKYERRLFNNFNNYQQVLTFLNQHFDFNYQYNETNSDLIETSIWETKHLTGSYFKSKLQTHEELEDYLDDSFCLYS